MSKYSPGASASFPACLNRTYRYSLSGATGEKRRSVEVIADSVQNLQPRDRSGEEPAPRRDAAAPAEPRAPERTAAPSAIEEDMREAFGDDNGGFDPFADA